MLLLFVEDDQDIRDSVTQVLEEEAGVTVVVAKDGQEALDWLLSSSVRPDGILLDLMMPNLDGYGFLTKKAEIPELRDIPVIAATAVNSVKCRMHEEIGACCLILQKPFDLDRLLAAVRNMAPPSE